MATLREVRSRISGVRKTQKITKAMKMVAAAKLRRAQMAIVSARPYARSLRGLLQNLVQGGELPPGLLQPRPVRSVAVVLVTSDRGLCGAFNANVVRATNAHIQKTYPELLAAGRVRLFCIGKKGVDAFNKQPALVAGKYPGIFGHLTFGEAQKITREIVGKYERGEVDRVDLIYNEFKSVGQQRLTVEQYLPLPMENLAGGGRHPRPTDYIFEPDREAIQQSLIPRHLEFQIWRILLESFAAEQGARMSAMENATENANEMISTLQLQYNKARQASITKELLEVVSGAEALISA